MTVQPSLYQRIMDASGPSPFGAPISSNAIAREEALRTPRYSDYTSAATYAVFTVVKNSTA